MLASWMLPWSISTQQAMFTPKQARAWTFHRGESGPSLFGCNWLTSIRPERESIKTMTSTPLSEVLEQHKSVFEERLGKLKGHEAKIYVDSSAQPRSCKARSVPYAWREKLEAELARTLAERRYYRADTVC